jgi:hypothetical protein
MGRAWPKAGNAALVMTALLALVLTGTDAWSKGGGSGGGRGGGHSGKSGSHHHHNGMHHSHPVGGGGGFIYGTYWAYPAFWYADAFPYLPAQPIVYYIERSEEELQSPSVWYYCEGEAAYYPYVSQCPEGWVKVEPFALP